MNTICVFIEKIVRTTQTKKISKNLPEQKSRNPLCIKGGWNFLFDEKLRETREILSKKRSNAEPGKKEKSLENVVFSRLFGGGEEGIRTLVGLPPNGFQDRLVMTASIPLRIKYSIRMRLALRNEFACSRRLRI